MTAPKVSFILPVFNAENYLARCLNSVVRQSLSPIEIICIDDASTDSSLRILHQFQEAHANLHVVLNAVNAGESHARNRGIERATGEYLAFVDNDDEIDPTFAETLYTAAKEHDYDIMKGNTLVFGYDGRPESDDLQLNADIVGKSRFYFTRHWWSAIYRTGMVKNHLRLPEGKPLGGDFLFLMEAMCLSRSLCCTDAVSYRYFRREDSGDSRLLPEAKIDSILWVYDRIAALLDEQEVARRDSAGFAHIRKLLIRASLNLIPRCLGEASKLRCLGYARGLALASGEGIRADVFAEKERFRQYLQGELTAQDYLAGGAPSRAMARHLREMLRKRPAQASR